MEGDFLLRVSKPEDLNGFQPAYPKDVIFFDDILFYITNFPAMTLLHKGRPMAIGGLVQMREGVFSSWNIVSKDAKKHKTTVFKNIVTSFRLLVDNVRDNGLDLRKIQAVVALKRQAAVKLNYLLGFEPEAVLKNYDKLEQDCLIMSICISRRVTP